jgi:hypothetical protein
MTGFSMTPLFQQKSKKTGTARRIRIGIEGIGLVVRTSSDAAGTNIINPIIPCREIGISKFEKLGLGLAKNSGLTGNSADDAADDGNRDQA